jgi:hypothetical protein
MPPAARLFIQVFIALPGFLIWLVGSLLAILYCSALFSSGQAMSIQFVGFLAACFAIVTLGHLMQVLAGYLNGTPRFRFVGKHFGERLAWDTAVNYLCIATAAAGWSALLGTIVDPRPVMAACVAFVLSAILLIKAAWTRTGRMNLWQQEIDELEAQRRVMESMPPSAE